MEENIPNENRGYCHVAYILEALFLFVPKWSEYDPKALTQILVTQGTNSETSERQMRCSQDLELEVLLPMESRTVKFT